MTPLFRVVWLREASMLPRSLGVESRRLCTGFWTLELNQVSSFLFVSNVPCSAMLIWPCQKGDETCLTGCWSLDRMLIILLKAIGFIDITTFVWKLKSLWCWWCNDWDKNLKICGNAVSSMAILKFQNLPENSLGFRVVHLHFFFVRYLLERLSFKDPNDDQRLN